MYRPLVDAPELHITRPHHELAACSPPSTPTPNTMASPTSTPSSCASSFGKTAAQEPNARNARCPIVADGLVALVAATGLVYPCYALYMNSHRPPDVQAIGDLRSQRFTDVWTGTLRQDVVRAVDATRCPDCRFQGHNFILWDLADQRPDPDSSRDDNDPHWRFL